MKIRPSICLAVLLGLTSCRAITPQQAPVFLTDVNPELGVMRSFEKLRLAKPESPEFERARIDYLLERLSHSPYTFVRNGEVYSAARAAMHLRWKYVLRHEDVRTANDFIRKVASRSKKSGGRYYLSYGKGRTYPLNELLRNELKHLDELMIQARIAEPGQANQASQEVHDPLKETAAEAENDGHNLLKTQADNA